MVRKKKENRDGINMELLLKATERNGTATKESRKKHKISFLNYVVLISSACTTLLIVTL